MPTPVHRHVTSQILQSDPVSTGATAVIYDLLPAHIVKLYLSETAGATAAREFRCTNATREAGLPVPAAHELVEVAGRPGIVFDRCPGTTAMDNLTSDPERMGDIARLLARLHSQILSAPAPAEVPLIHERLLYQIDHAPALPDALGSRIREALHSKPNGSTLCHGDFHPGNVMLAETGPVIIDWTDATAGPAISDIARTSVLALGSVATENDPRMRELVMAFYNAYLEAYRSVDPVDDADLQSWISIHAAARLEEGVPGWDDWLLSMAERL